MKFGEWVRELRHQRKLTQRELASRLGVTFTYLSKVENEHLAHVDYPSEKFIVKLADALEAGKEELLLLADKLPEAIRRRVQERPDAFRVLAGLDDKTLDRLLARVSRDGTRR